MGNYENLKQSITEVIRTNGNKEITGAVLQSTLLTIISTVGANATFAGIATPATNPGTPDGPVFYLASESGTYSNFGSIELQDGLSALMWNGSWSGQQILSIDDVPTAESGNLVKSGGVYAKLFPLETLINASENIITNAPITSTYEQISYANGNQVSMGNNGYKCSGFIDVSDIDALSYKMYTGYVDVALIAAYDENQTYIQENSVASVADSNKEGKWIKGITTKFIRFSIVQNKSFAYIGNQHDSLENDRVNYANEFASINTKLDNVKSSINELCVLKSGTNYQTLNADGSLNTAVGNPSTYVTGYIDVSLIDFIKYNIYKSIFDSPQCVIAAYNENKEFISANSIISSASGRYEGVWEKGSTTKFIRIGFRQYANEISSAIISGRVVKDIISNNLDIVAFGDSLTEGAGSQSGAPSRRLYPFTEHLKTFIDAKRTTPSTIINAGIGGEASWNIGYRQGGLSVKVMPFTIPSTTTAVEVTLKGQYDDYSFYNSQWNLDSENAPHTSFAVTAASKINPIKIAGIEGTLTISNGKYYFTRTTAGDAITLSVPVFLDTYASRAYKDYIQIIWVGTNDAPLINGQYIMQEGLNERINDMINANNTQKYIILGLTNGSSESNVSRDMAFIKSFGSHFLNIREYISKYGITIANEQGAEIEITPTVEQNIANGIIDSSLKVDGVHGNYYFYYAVAKAIYDKGVSLNYWE